MKHCPIYSLFPLGFLVRLGFLVTDRALRDLCSGEDALLSNLPEMVNVYITKAPVGAD